MSWTLPSHVLMRYKTKSFIETGTNGGQGCQLAVNCGFEDVRSVELIPELYELAKANLTSTPNIKLYLGKSEECIPLMLEDINHQCTFWLDGHSDYNCPVMRELEAIKQHHVKNHFILIDDVNMFGTPIHENITVDEMKDFILTINDKYQFIIEHNILIAYI
tara:strand:+ start:3941 stop:4426 length:486 start_codon:yes stop_codon:yes gene_type:complete